MVDAILVREFGGPERLELGTVELTEPAATEVRIKQTAIGVNFIDTYFRTGLYPVDLPFIPGEEGVGFVEQVGSDVVDFKPGDRVAYSTNFHNGYMTHRNMEQAELVHVPDNISDTEVVSSLLRGLTAEYLLFRCYTLQVGQSVLIHAAAGGVGSITSQWAKHIGAQVFGTASNSEKVELAKSYGCDHVINYTTDSFYEVVKSKTQGELLDVVYDGVGKATLKESMRCIKSRGLLVSFGNASGAPDLINVLDLSSQGSIYLTRPKLYDYISDPQELRAAAARYFTMLADKKIRIPNVIELSLKDAAKAHTILEDRSISEIPVLIPD